MKRAVVRLPSEVVERLDLLAQKLRAAKPTRAVSRAAIVRALIATGLEVVEADVARRAAARREEGGEHIAEAGEAGRSPVMMGGAPPAQPEKRGRG